MITIIAYAVGGVWLATLFVALLSRSKAAQIASVVSTLAFAAIWSRTLFLSDPASARVKADPVRAGASCASVEPGQTEAALRTRLGEPSEIRDEAELRGPNASAWVYRDSRCAVHLLNGVVESVE